LIPEEDAMTKLWLLGSMLMFASVASCAEPEWINDYEEAKAAARRTGKPILLVFR
jgi:hypothetical protein